MTTLFVANNRTEEMVGGLASLTEAQRHASGFGAQRILWFARDHDVVVLPWAPDPDYLAQVAALTGTDAGSVRIVVPPPGRAGRGLLTSDRLADPGFRATLAGMLAERGVDTVFPMYPEPSVAALASFLGLADALPGHRFAAQGGSLLANSKAAFRALAGGAGVPVAPGAVAASEGEAVEAITALLAPGRPVIVKKDFHSGSDGNEILSTTAELSPVGAQRVEVLRDSAEIGAYVAGRWDWLSDGGRHRVVIERYFTGSRPLYAEFVLDEPGSTLVGHGEMLMTPVYSGGVIPAQHVDPAVHAEFLAAAARTCAVYHAMGHRGPTGVDAILTPADGLLLSEVNARVCGSTHLFHVVGRTLVGDGFLTERILVERPGLRAPSFRDAVEFLDRAGLGYRAAERTGVLVTCPMSESFRYCVVARDGAELRDHERRLAEALPALAVTH